LAGGDSRQPDPNMKKPSHILHSFACAFGAFCYTAGVAWFLFHAQFLFGKVSNFLGPFLILLLFIISALVTGLLILGKPVELYLGGSKKEALDFLFITLVWLVLFSALTALALRFS
jgi:hypothetical protein